ncbi:MFS general substrate transporter [Gonapodya prolifera JEL478]|uniref:MFS general substrate transporter n=1 Tax=Gonapodya prolifera (strain JEL478) TaxID=1344416 RepID=A0A139AJG5_GONPJ|nr:MFS general substrate transporter [Gonapodya prolifera JEL478]|eukprot:KXS16946.1 MFS general substrate transporter [Gonapodya prolifera JEL478]
MDRRMSASAASAVLDSLLVRRSSSRPSPLDFEMVGLDDEKSRKSHDGVDDVELVASIAGDDALMAPFLVDANGRGSKHKRIVVEKKNFTFGTVLALSSFNFGYNAFWFIVSIVIQPAQIRQIVGDADKGTALAQVAGVSGLVNLFSAVYFGAINDKMRGWRLLGRRKPWIAFGVTLLAVVFWWLSADLTLLQYGTGYIFLTLGNILPSVAWYGLIADITPPGHQMRISSITGASGLLGNLAGAVVGSFYTDLGERGIKVVIISALLVTSLVTLVWVKEPDRSNEPGIGILETIDPRTVWRVLFVEAIEPLKSNPGFRMVFLARFLFQLGINTVTQFYQYALQDCVTLPPTLPATSAVSMALLPLLLISPLAASLLTLRSLRDHRKHVVYATGSIIIIVACLLGWVEKYIHAVVLAGVFGLGYGPFISVEFAMVLDVLEPTASGTAKPNRRLRDTRSVDADRLPMHTDTRLMDIDAYSHLADSTDTPDPPSSDAEPFLPPPTVDSHFPSRDHPSGAAASHARDLSLWHSAMILPSIFATPVAGGLRDYFQKVGQDVGVHCLGYKSVWATVVIYCTAGMIATRYIPGLR